MPATADLALVKPVDATADLRFGWLPGAPPVHVAGSIPLGELLAFGGLRYSVNVFRGPQHATRAPFEASARRAAAAGTPWAPRPRRGARIAVTSAEPARSTSRCGAHWRTPARARIAIGVMVEQAIPAMRQRFALPYDSPPQRGARPPVTWLDADALHDAWTAVFLYPPSKRTHRAVPWAQAAHAPSPRIVDVWLSDPRRRPRAWSIPWEVAARILRLWPHPPWPPGTGVVPVPPYVPTPDLAFWCLFDGSQPVLLQIGRSCAPVIPAGPSRRVYIVLHDVTVVRLPERTPIRASTLRIDLDVDAWAWAIQATLLGRDALDLVVPAGDGSPTHIEVSIDGYLWRFIVERWGEERRFGERAVSISGRSEVALLSEPHVLPSAYLAAGDLLAQQIAAAMLPFGWTLDWSAPDWLVPNGAYSHTARTPAQAVAAIAAAAGLAAIPRRAGYGWTVRKVYETLPWQFEGAIADRTIATAQLVGLTRALSLGDRGRANAVIVHGGETAGILASVRLLGTAGDRLAATYGDPLITAVEAARAAGERLLAREYLQPPIEAVELPLSHSAGDFPLIELCDLLDLRLGGDAGLAVATGISVAATMTDRRVTVRQQVRLGEVARNVAADFGALGAGEPVTPGQVSTVHGDGTATVLLASGGVVRASRGAMSLIPGARVYVRGQAITGPAPTFPSYVIEV